MSLLNLISALLLDNSGKFYTDSKGRRLSVQEIVNAYNELYNQAQELYDQYNALCEEYDELLDLHNQLCDEYNALIEQ
ncbi:hypothetical protein [uncultured Alistipes sp.]|jgi:hypothetical protein|uniref:hypothetical protein n=1 Tax=Alistipes sp. TaxID=1872444 RepID=UPI00266C71F9|nr:hypothetical protein [uncultured Alistipes sp.]